MKTRRPLLLAGLAATLVIAVFVLVENLSPTRRPVPASTMVEGLSPSEAEVVYAKTCRVLSASYRSAISQADLKEAWLRFCDRYFAQIESLKTNSDGSIRVLVQTRWPGRGGAQLIMDFPALRPDGEGNEKHVP